MKLLRASAEPGVLQRLKSALEDAEIECVIRNELMSGLSPEVPVAESMPELWLVDDGLLPRAQEVLADLKTDAAAGREPWTCPQCGERLEPQFTSCWNCGSDPD